MRKCVGEQRNDCSQTRACCRIVPEKTNLLEKREVPVLSELTFGAYLPKEDYHDDLVHGKELPS